MRRGSETPRIWTPPLRELTPETTAGFSIIEFADEVLGVELFPWQRWLVKHAFEVREDGGFRFRTVIVLVARQNGKSLLAQVIALWFIYVLGAALVLGTAQSLDVSEETWEGAVEMAQAVPELAGEIERVVRVNGKKELGLYGRHRYKVAPSSRKGGRGKTTDLAILDELREHLNWEAWAAVTKSTMARPNAVVLGLSNAGDAFSVVLRHERFVAHRQLGDPDGWCAATGDAAGDMPEGADADSIGIFEWSAEPECDLSDRDQWAQANPSLGYTITEEAVAAALASDPEAKFRTEVLCQWVETISEEPFPEGSWDAGTDAESSIPMGNPVCYGIDVDSDRTSASIAAAGRRADGRWHIEVVARRTGLGWAVRWIEERAAQAANLGGEFRFAYQKRGAPVSSIADMLQGIEGAEAVEVEGRELAGWCGRLWDGIAACGDGGVSDAVPVMHRPQPALDAAAKVAAVKPLGDGAWVFDRSRSPEDVAPLMACAMAFGLASTPREKPKVIESAYTATRGLMFV